MARRWDDAIAQFEELLREYPEDGPAQLFLARLQEFRANAPSPDWDGVYVMNISDRGLYDKSSRFLWMIAGIDAGSAANGMGQRTRHPRKKAGNIERSVSGGQDRSRSGPE